MRECRQLSLYLPKLRNTFGQVSRTEIVEPPHEVEMNVSPCPFEIAKIAKEDQKKSDVHEDRTHDLLGVNLRIVEGLAFVPNSRKAYSHRLDERDVITTTPGHHVIDIISTQNIPVGLGYRKKDVPMLLLGRNGFFSSTIRRVGRNKLRLSSSCCSGSYQVSC